MLSAHFQHYFPSMVLGSRFFIIRHIHNHTSIISSEMQVELKKNNLDQASGSKRTEANGRGGGQCL